jgi:hypothetical protein
VDAQWDGLAGGLLADDALDVDNVLETVDRGDLALTSLVGATDNGDLIILADWDGADLILLLVYRSLETKCAAKTYVVLLTELLGERGAHDGAANAGWRAEVRLARLAAGGVEGAVDLGHLGGW